MSTIREDSWSSRGNFGVRAVGDVCGGSNGCLPDLSLPIQKTNSISCRCPNYGK